MNTNPGPIGMFPFGQPLHDVVQTDRSPKHVFVLGVYASAVHACWVDHCGRCAVRALAVASEPYIFWRGENAEALLEPIAIPAELGSLTPARPEFNGPSGKALDSRILEPLGLSRDTAWLCDLVPHSCVNPAQQAAVERAYLPLATRYALPEPSVPRLPRRLTDARRRAAILDEIAESKAQVLILLGDLPIAWFLAHQDPRWCRLSDFTGNGRAYGQLHRADVGGREMGVLPLAHPRQIARLGRSSADWHALHADWLARCASRVGEQILRAA